jgi:hypothetical protein
MIEGTFKGLSGDLRKKAGIKKLGQYSNVYLYLFDNAGNWAEIGFWILTDQ